MRRLSLISSLTLPPLKLLLRVTERVSKPAASSRSAQKQSTTPPLDDTDPPPLDEFFLSAEEIEIIKKRKVGGLSAREETRLCLHKYPESEWPSRIGMEDVEATPQIVGILRSSMCKKTRECRELLRGFTEGVDGGVDRVGLTKGAGEGATARRQVTTVTAAASTNAASAKGAGEGATARRQETTGNPAPLFGPRKPDNVTMEDWATIVESGLLERYGWPFTADHIPKDLEKLA